MGRICEKKIERIGIKQFFFPSKSDFPYLERITLLPITAIWKIGVYNAFLPYGIPLKVHCVCEKIERMCAEKFFPV
jgi:hypothetical protein